MTATATVIVPTFERPAALAACLAALANLRFPEGCLEVVVVNDGGNFPDDVPIPAGLRVQIIHQRNAGPASARNAGAARATGSVLAFTDDDCRPDPDWLAHLVRTVAADRACLAGGSTVNSLTSNLFATASQLLIDYLYEHFNRDQDAPGFFTSNNFAVDAARFRDMGGFATSFRRAAGEDRDFCDAWLHRGGRLCYVPEAVVQHAHHLSLRRFWRQHFHYGSGARRFHMTRALRGQTRPRVEPLAFYARLLAYPLRRRPLVQSLPLVGLMLLSQVANVAGYLAERVRGGHSTKEST